MNEIIEIPLSKKKIFFLLIGATVFVIIGILFILKPESYTTILFRNPEKIRIAGIASVLFFGLCEVFIGKKLFDNKVGLTIDQNGITDNSNATSIGLVEWKDIKGIEILQIMSTKTLILMTDKPDKYIDRAKNGISRRAMKANHKMHGSPLSIISNSLKIKFEDLESLIRNEFAKRENKNAL